MQTAPTVKRPLEIPQTWWLRAMAAVAMLALLAITAPLITLAVTAGAGLITLGSMALVGFVALQALPLGLQKLENRLLKLRKQEAQDNPIEQLQNDCLRREERLKAFRRALVNIGGQIESMRQMLHERRDKAPHHVLDKQERAIARMDHFYKANIARLDEAHHALEDFRSQVKQKVFEWEFAKAGQDVMAALNPSEMQDLVQDLLSDEALRAVQNRFNMVFAELDVDLRSINAPTRNYLADTALDPMEALSVMHQKPARSLS
ncbi:MAG: hypothetical protein IPG23_24365 [Burkholderiales bacterium]|jgi:hypothetical protein|nr:hypothetical protein [Burkholderiales bacterium]